MGLRDLAREWRARRAGRRYVTSDLPRSARDVVGPTGWMWSKGWDAMARGSAAYVASFDRRLPPSTFVSARDLTRSNMPIPLVERCIEDRAVEPPVAAPVAAPRR
jgi:hypothetical protein